MVDETAQAESSMKKIDSFFELVNDYDGFLFDAYGVLVNENGCLKGVKELLQSLSAANKYFYLLTNGSSRTVENTARRYNDLGLAFTEENVITSGGLLAAALDQLSEPAESVVVLGTSDSKLLATAAGRKVVPLNLAAESDVRTIVIANQTDFPFLESIDKLLSYTISALDHGKKITIILTNPDLFYPKSDCEFGITAGSIGLVLEQCLALRYGKIPDIFIKLGKPYSPMFDEAIRRAGTKNLLMVGDQLQTDILGANRSGLDSLLVGTGLTNVANVRQQNRRLWPTYFCQDLERR